MPVLCGHSPDTFQVDVIDRFTHTSGGILPQIPLLGFSAVSRALSSPGGLFLGLQARMSLLFLPTSPRSHFALGVFSGGMTSAVEPFTGFWLAASANAEGLPYRSADCDERDLRPTSLQVKWPLGALGVGNFYHFHRKLPRRRVGSQ